MTKELDALYSLWADFIITRGENGFFVDDEDTRAMFAAEVFRIQQMIRSRINFGKTTRKEIKVYVRLLERKFICFGNEIAKAAPLFLLFETAVNRLLDFLKVEYKDYFDFNLIALASFKAEVIGRMELQVKHIIQSHIFWKIEESLARIIADYMEQKGYVVRTFGQLDYYELFCETFYKASFDTEESTNRDNLLSLLAYINFNSPQFILYCKRSIPKKRHLESIENGEIFADRLRVIRYVTDQQIHAFDHSGVPVKQQIISLLQAELHHATTMNGLRSKPHQEDKVEPISAMNFKVNLTLEQILFFFRVFIKIKIFVPPSLVKLYAVIEGYISTRDKVRLSSGGSIKNKYNAVTPTTIRKVKEVLHTALEYINKNY